MESLFWVRVEYFPKTYVIGITSNDFTSTEITETLIPKNLEIEISSCPCSTTLIGTRRTMKRNVFLIPKSENYAKRSLRGHWTFFGHVVWFIFSKSEGKWSSVAALQRFVETGYPILQATVLWIVESWKEIKTKTPFTSQQNLRMWNSYSESFTPRISSVSTEKCRTGLDSTVLQVLSQLHEILSKARQPLTKKRRRVWIQNK